MTQNTDLENDIKKKILLLTFILYSITVHSQKIWSFGTANVLSKNELNINLLQKSGFGYNNNLEIQTNPFYFYFIPNIGIKYKWFEKNNNLEKKLFKKIGFILTSKHSLSFPSKILNYTQNLNLFEYNPNPTKIYNFISLNNEIITTFSLRKNKSCYNNLSYLTIRMGNIIAIKNNNYIYSIKKNALLYRITGMFDDKSLWYIGLQYDNKFSYGLYYKISINLYSIGIKFNNLLIDQQSLAYVYVGKNKRIRCGLGYLITNSFSKIKPSVMPTFTLGYLINIKTGNKHSKNLFRKGVIQTPEEDRDMF